MSSTSAAEINTHAVSAGFATFACAAIAGRAHVNRDKNVKTIVDEGTKKAFRSLGPIENTPFRFN